MCLPPRGFQIWKANNIQHAQATQDLHFLSLFSDVTIWGGTQAPKFLSWSSVSVYKQCMGGQDRLDDMFGDSPMCKFLFL